MSESRPEDPRQYELPREPGQSIEEKSINHSAQSIGIEPSDTFVPPTMALDAYEPESD